MTRLVPIAAAVVVAAVITAALVRVSAPGDGTGQRFTTIGTGGVTGVYYPAGGAICRLLNRERVDHGIHCSVESTAGSIYNLNALRQGGLDFGIVQSDWQYHAHAGSDQFAEAGPHEDLRAVLRLHAEPFTVLTRRDTGVASFADIRGQRVNVGNPGSGQRGTAERLMAAYDWTMDDFSLAAELPSREQAAALCDRRIDVVLFTVGHPSGSIQEPVATCDARLVDVTGHAVDALVAETPYYAHATIPAEFYPGHDTDTATFGVSATLVTTAQVDEEVVYRLTRAVLENLETFQRLHPAFRTLEAGAMADPDLPAPLHRGARRYFREQGLLEAAEDAP